MSPLQACTKRQPQKKDQNIISVGIQPIPLLAKNKVVA